MSDHKISSDSFDVDRELEELMRSVNAHSKAGAPQGRTESTQHQQRPPQQMPPQQMPEAVPQRTAQHRQESPSQRPVQQRQEAVHQRPNRQSTAQQGAPQHRQNDKKPSLTSRLSRTLSLNMKSTEPKIVTKTNNGIKMYEDKTDYSRMDDKDASYYTGEVYFASKKPAPIPVATPENGASSVKTGSLSYKINNFLKNGGKKAAIIYVAILVVISVLFSVYLLSLLNDIFAFNRSDDVKTITVSENATTNQIIKQLDKAGLIKHRTFCKVFMGLTKSLHEVSGKPVYLSGVYYLKPSMGLEKMLLSCQEVHKAETVTVTIPEGFSIQQIAEKLEKSKVCMSDEFYNNIKSAQFSYSFLKGIENKSSRYEYLEGYLYPDTYEFYVGQNASSVINTLLENFEKRFPEEYKARAKEMGMSIDEVVTLASIVQKEADDAEQMPIVAKIFLNRLSSSNFPSLQSDATNVYVNKYIKPNVTSGEFDSYWQKYSTYACIGLPAGPICSPGDDAIKAVLWPADTDAYYFCHDSSGNIYTAKTEAEHNANYYKALSGTGDSDE